MGSWGRLVLGSVLLLAGCTAGGETAAPVVTTAGSAPTGCGSKVETGPLPDWADAGFSGDTRGPHVFGAKGTIVGVLFGYPLTAGRTDGANNKILWVSGPGATSSDTSVPDTLIITATLDGTDTKVVREVAGGPGPSITDMPQAGCWHLELRWSGRTDTMDLTYGAPTSS